MFGQVSRALHRFPNQAELRNEGNGGDGSDASSGSASAFGPGAKAYSGAGGNATGGNVGHRAFIDVRTSERMLYSRLSPRRNYGPTHPGAGKYPTSESKHHDHDSLVNAWSGTLLLAIILSQ